MSFGRRAASLLLLALASVEAQVVDPEFIDRPWINEFHYDNKGTDVDEFIEVAAPEGFDIGSWQLILYNGFYGRMYEEDALHPLVTFTKGDTINGVDFYYLPIKQQNCSAFSSWCGLENGKDGFALANYFSPTSGRVVELLSYEGTFVAKDGPATNMTSNDIGVMQGTNTPRGHSISKIGTGCGPDDFYWANVDVSTMGTVNTNQTTTCDVVFINELHYANTNGGEGQFVEVATNVEDISTYSLVLYSGEDGMAYDAILLSSFEMGDTSDDGLTFYSYIFPSGGTVGLDTGSPVTVNGTETTGPAGMALVNNDEVVLEFISYSGEFTAMDGAAEGMTSMDIGVTESAMTPVGSSLQLTGEGCSSENFVWAAVEANQIDINPMGSTPGQINIGQDIVCFVEVETETADEDVVAPEDDLLGDDDFLDDNVVMIVSKTVTTEYEEGEGKSVPID